MRDEEEEERKIQTTESPWRGEGERRREISSRLFSSQIPRRQSAGVQSEKNRSKTNTYSS